MTTAFRDFLGKQAEIHQAEALAGKVTVDEWRAALERLFAQIRLWLKESDPDNVIGIEDRKWGADQIGREVVGRKRFMAALASYCIATI